MLHNLSPCKRSLTEQIFQEWTVEYCGSFWNLVTLLVRICSWRRTLFPRGKNKAKNRAFASSPAYPNQWLPLSSAQSKAWQRHQKSHSRACNLSATQNHKQKDRLLHTFEPIMDIHEIVIIFGVPFCATGWQPWREDGSLHNLEICVCVYTYIYIYIYINEFYIL